MGQAWRLDEVRPAAPAALAVDAVQLHFLPQCRALSSRRAVPAHPRHARDGVDHHLASRPRWPRRAAPTRSCSRGSCRQVSDTLTATIVESVSAIDAAMWNALVAATDPHKNPFLDHALFLALEQSGSATRRTGWTPRHIVLARRRQDRRRAAPLRKVSLAGRICLRPRLGQRIRAGRRQLLPQAAIRRSVHPGHRTRSC